MFLETNPMPVKAAMALMGLIKNNLRLPLVTLSHNHYTELKAALEKSGISR